MAYPSIKVSHVQYHGKIGESYESKNFKQNASWICGVKSYSDMHYFTHILKILLSFLIMGGCMKLYLVPALYHRVFDGVLSGC